MCVESTSSEEVPTIQIISTDYLHVEKEGGKENICGQQEEGGK